MIEGEHPYRYCVYCGADTYVPEWEEGDVVLHRDPGEVEHDADCPVKTGVFPVRPEDLGPLVQCPHCDESFRAFGMRCMDCEVELVEGDTYMQRQVAEDTFEAVCVGCALLNPSEQDFERRDG